MSKITYIKCPRCDLNYIDSRQEMCDICKAELGLMPKDILLDDDFDLEEETKLCPVCKRNYIPIEEEMCDSCLRAMENKDPLENDDSWVEFIDDDPLEKDIVEIPLEELQDEEFADDEEEAEEETEEYKDDFEDDFEDDFKFDDKFEYDDDDIDEDEDDELDEDE